VTLISEDPGFLWSCGIIAWREMLEDQEIVANEKRAIPDASGKRRSGDYRHRPIGRHEFNRMLEEMIARR
jgi:hypothetical protein